jgi:hypothetical protein
MTSPTRNPLLHKYDRVLDTLAEKLPKVAAHTSTPPAPTCSRSPPSPKRSGARSGPTTPCLLTGPPHHFTTRAQARDVVLAWCHEF